MAPIGRSGSKKTVLVIDDEYKALVPIFKAINREVYEVVYSSGGDVSKYIEGNNHVGVIITDLKATRIGAIGLLNKIKNTLPETAFLITSPTGVILYKDKNFYEYLGHSLLHSINEILDVLLCSRNHNQNKRLHSFGAIIGASEVMQEVYARIEIVAKTNITVLVQGETGTGKELVAKTIHVRSQRSKGPFVPINCGAIPPTLIESELFGHEKGAFSSAYQTKKGLFEIAHGGTIFLDEIAEIDKASQVKLLRVLQEKTAQRVGSTKVYETNTRVIAATSKDLQKEVFAGNFREDLFYRINVFPIYLPPLRERKDDIPILVEYFTTKYSREVGKKGIRITREAMDVFCRQEYPGNVRELENLVIRSLISCKNNIIDAPDVLDSLSSTLHKSFYESNVNTSFGNVESLEDIEKNAIINALSKTKGNKKAAARILGITRRLLYLRLKKYDIGVENFSRV